MKADPITKCYAGLTLKERAALAFRYSAALDEQECMRIASTVPRVTLTGAALEYSQWFEILTRMALWWGVEHWQYKARAMAAMGAHQITSDAGKKTEAGAFLEAVRCWESRLLALDVALDAAAAEHGFDAEGVRAVSNAAPFEPIFIKEPTPEHIDQEHKVLRRLLVGM